jgi:hypothetical protein
MYNALFSGTGKKIAIRKRPGLTAKAISSSPYHSSLLTNFILCALKSLFQHVHFHLHNYYFVLLVVPLFHSHAKVFKALLFHLRVDALMITCVMWTSSVCVHNAGWTGDQHVNMQTIMTVASIRSVISRLDCMAAVPAVLCLLVFEQN